MRVGEHIPLGGTNVTSIVLRTGRTARLDDYGVATGTIGDYARQVGTRSVVAAPIVVDGRTWGVLAAVWADVEPPPDDTEKRMARFAGLLETAIANADTRDQLTESRARVLAAGDDARRRVVRDLHDGAQQRLVNTIIALKLAKRALDKDPANVETLLADALGTAEQAITDLRELSHGILPSVLASGGLRSAVDAVVSRLNLPVEAQVLKERLPPDIEASAYFILAESLTNVVKHAQATYATVRAAVDEGVLILEVRDDGVGGANREGHGLTGLADRVEAVGGRLRVESAAGKGRCSSPACPCRPDAGARPRAAILRSRPRQRVSMRAGGHRHRSRELPDHSARSMRACSRRRWAPSPLRRRVAPGARLAASRPDPRPHAWSLRAAPARSRRCHSGRRCRHTRSVHRPDRATDHRQGRDRRQRTQFGHLASPGRDECRTVLVGHGQPWTGGARAAS